MFGTPDPHGLLDQVLFLNPKLKAKLSELRQHHADLLDEDKHRTDKRKEIHDELRRNRRDHDALVLRIKQYMKDMSPEPEYTRTPDALARLKLRVRWLKLRLLSASPYETSRLTLGIQALERQIAGPRTPHEVAQHTLRIQGLHARIANIRDAITILESKISAYPARYDTPRYCSESNLRSHIQSLHNALRKHMTALQTFVDKHGLRSSLFTDEAHRELPLAEARLAQIIKRGMYHDDAGVHHHGYYISKSELLNELLELEARQKILPGLIREARDAMINAEKNALLKIQNALANIEF